MTIWWVLLQGEIVSSAGGVTKILEAPAGVSAVEWAVYGISFVSVAMFAVVGVALFSRRWESYEERYLQDADRTLESMLLTIPPQQLIYLSFLGAIAGGLLMFVVSGQPGIAAVVGLMCFPCPRLLLRFLKKRRDKIFSNQLVDALSSLYNSLKAGMSLPQGFQQLEVESKNPMKQEIRIMLQEMRLGKTLPEALGGVYKRMPSEDMDLISVSVEIATKVGGALHDVFKKLENTIRERRRIEGKVNALTAQGRFQGLVMAVMPAFILVALSSLNPSMVEPLFNSFAGWVLIGICVGMDYLGYWCIKKIVSIDI